MSQLTKHVGQYKNLNRKLVVVFRRLPDEPESCLVVETESLPDMYHDNLMQIVNSNMAQERGVVDLYEVLNRSQFGDGTNALTTLHQKQFLTKVPVNNVVLTPFPNQRVDLSVVNAEIDGTPLPQTTSADVAPQTVAEEAQVTLEPDQAKAQAEGLLHQATLMEQDAQRKREEAYKLCPELNVVKKGRPKKSDEEKKAAKEKRNQKRREKYAEEKAAKADEALMEQVNEKIIRDAERMDEESEKKSEKQE